MKLSIITISYNDKQGLINTCNSILNQSFDDLEHIIIDGDSSDGTKAYLKTLPEHIKCTSEPDTGIYNAMNKGIKKAGGDYLLFLNSGDTLRSTDILDQVIPYLGSDKTIYYGDLALQHEAGEKIRVYPDALSFYYFFHRGSLPHPAMFIKRELFATIGGYNEEFKIVSDWDFYVKAICKWQCTYEHMSITVSNFDTEGISSQPETRNLLLEEKEKSIKNNFSLFYTDYLALQIHKEKKINNSVPNALHQLAHNKVALKIYVHTSRLFLKLFGKKTHEKN